MFGHSKPHHIPTLQSVTSPPQPTYTPFRTRSLRSRNTTRSAVAALVIMSLIFIFNELRCVKYGCVSHVRWFGGDWFAAGTNVSTSGEGQGDGYGSGNGQGYVGDGGVGGSGDTTVEEAKVVPWEVSEIVGMPGGGSAGGPIATWDQGTEKNPAPEGKYLDEPQGEWKGGESGSSGAQSTGGGNPSHGGNQEADQHQSSGGSDSHNTAETGAEQHMKWEAGSQTSENTGGDVQSGHGHGHQTALHASAAVVTNAASSAHAASSVHAASSAHAASNAHAASSAHAASTPSASSVKAADGHQQNGDAGVSSQSNSASPKIADEHQSNVGVTVSSTSANTGQDSGNGPSSSLGDMLLPPGQKDGGMMGAMDMGQMQGGF